MDEIAWQEVAGDLAFPEGPVGLLDGDVLVVEVRAGRLTRIRPDGGRETVAEVGGGPNGAAIGPDGAAYVVNNGGFSWTNHSGLWIPIGEDGGNQPPGFSGGWVDRVDLATGRVDRLYDQFEGQPFAGPNDIVFDSAGGFYFTDFGKSRARTLDFGAVYYASVDGSRIVRVANHLLGPNGVGLSPDGSRLYAAETYTGRLVEWDLVSPGKTAGPARTVIATPEHFDSLAVEEDGTVVVAAIRGLCVVRPDRTWEIMDLPDVMTTNVCFAGEKRRTAFATLSGGGRLVAGEWPRPGLRLPFDA
jgi:gluconolactonase